MGIGTAVLAMSEDGFARRMEELSSAERREIFQQLHVPPAGVSASARQRNLRRIRAAWERLSETGDEAAAEMFARSWLGRSGMAMIREFLDGFGVEHDDGYLRDAGVLDQLDGSDVKAALAELGKKYDPADVRLYAILMSLPHDAAATDAAG